MSDFLDYDGLQRYHELISKKLPTSAGTAGLVLTSAGSGGIPIWKTGEFVHLELTTTGTAAVTTSPHNYSKWEVTDSEITELYDGLTILYKVPVAGHKTYGTCLQINSLGYHPVVTAVNSLISTRYAVGNYIILCYDSTQSSTIYNNSDTSSTITGVWRCVNDYDSGNTDSIPSAMLGTSASTAAKTATCSNYVLLNNSYLHVVVKTANSAKSALTLSVNSKTAKPIYINGTISSASNYTLPAGSYLVYYDGTNYYFRTDGKLTTVGLVNTSDAAIYTNNEGTVTKVTAGAGLNTTSNDSASDGGDITGTGTLYLTKSGVTAGTYKSVTVDKYGRVTAGTNPTDANTTYKFTIGTTIKGDSTNGVDLGTLKSETAAANGETLSLVTTGEKATWNSKGTYSKPSGGIPKTDLASAVLSSLGLADSSIQGVTVGSGGTNYTPTNGVVTIPAYPTTLPASDVSSWAKQSSKPSYAYSEIGFTVNAANNSSTTLSLDGTTPMHVITTTANITAVTLSANPAEGHSCHVIITASTEKTVSLTHHSTNRICPGGVDPDPLTIPAGGYIELNFLTANSKVYVRGV